MCFAGLCAELVLFSSWQVATALLGSALPLGNCQARILALIGGACTEGQGMVVGSELSEQIRSHKDLVKDAAPHYRKSRKFFEGVAAELVQHGHTLDIFTCSLDQVRGAQGRARDGKSLYISVYRLYGGLANQQLLSDSLFPRRRLGWLRCGMQCC